MNKNNEIEKNTLNKTIWKNVSELKKSIWNADEWDFKEYVFGIIFYRYISENLADYINQDEWKANKNTNFRYENIEDNYILSRKEEIKELIKDKGFFIKPSHLFINILKKSLNDKDLNVTLGEVFEEIESSTNGTTSEKSFKGLFADINLNNSKLGSTVNERNENLAKLIKVIGEMELGNFQDNSIESFGDVYEYLMSMYASNAGKSGGEYYTPQEVSELLAKITLVGKKEINKVYDPACGSGSLLLNFAKILGKEKVRNGFFGQETNQTTYNLCRINMFLHDINYNKFNISQGDTLTNPLHNKFEPFEAIVSNPPYSIKWAGKSNPLLINDPRFSPAGVLAPESKADLAFIMHSLSYLAVNGTAAIVTFPGVMYRGGAEQKIRKYLVDNNFIDAIIQLPENLFFGTSIATCILVLKKNKLVNDILFIDASKEFQKITNSNKLSKENISKILNTYEKRIDLEHFTNKVSNNKISEENYNLSVSTYIGQKSEKEIIDINLLNEEIKTIVTKGKVLREEIDKIIKEIEN
ncbi:type I restriction-modification system subunit M [[Mycoplasma] mobile]|uniref:site-specific DNA-methyltransferase (adenine-specific) n=1 Tax=Mycoplasma mobile (strain ATCC 43663 / 163K / NCTC 11711) TaxID=267748 RepID=Q6KI06_MYCM1|nr:type I restriction-modification system subunit M [[Mycoplasma] mobile]AAT27770.1 type I restriction enzyme m protein [Mycoplasma mobile 163K]